MVEPKAPADAPKSVWICELKQGGEAYGKTPSAQPFIFALLLVIS